MVSWMFTSLHEILSAEKVACYKGAPEEITPHGSLDVTDWWSSAVNNQMDQSDCIPNEIFSTSKPGAFDCFFQELRQVCSISLSFFFFNKTHTLV